MGWLAVPAGQAFAQQGVFTGMQAGVESTFSSVMTRVTFASGAVTTTSSQNVYPILRLNISTLLYPGLRLTAGDVYEVNAFANHAGPLTTNSSITGNRPFVLLRSTNPTLSPGVGYFRRVARDRTVGLSDVSLTNDEYDGYLGWQPEGGPRSDFQYVRTNTYDGQRAFQNIEKDFASALSQYHYQDLGLYYRGAYLRTADQIGGLDSRQTTNFIRGDYSQTFLQKRLVWNVTGNLNRQDVTTEVHGTGGEVALPIIPFAGLSVISDTPVTARLSTNPQLIDGTLTASAGINLGVPVTPLDAQLRNIGLDLLTPTEVNRFLLWVDRTLPVEISNAFSWDVYTSTDNVLWQRVATVPVAPFGDFENRFEIDFPGVTARYVKLVTRPLSAAVQDSSRFQDIFVTELQAFVRRATGQMNSRVSQNGYLVNTDARLRLLDSPNLYYEGYYLANGNNGFNLTTDTLSNGVSVNHSFGRIFSTFGRFAVEQGRQAQGFRTATVTNATLTIEPIHTFRTSVLYSGLNERVADVPDSRRGLFIQNALQPYRGIDLLAGIGWTSMTRSTGEISHDRLLNLSATITPRQRVSLTLNYDAIVTARSGVFVGDPETREHRSYAALSFDPVRTLHLVLGGEVIASTGQTTRTTLDTNVSWAPFPDGTLQIIFAYNESLRALEFGRDKNTLGAVRWNISRKNYIDVSYQRTKSANELLVTESKIFSVHVRLFL